MSAITEPSSRADLPGWLRGRWSIRRVINDGAGDFVGEAEFGDDAAGDLSWRESGRLRLAGHVGPAGRTLRLTPASRAGVWQVWFDDGRPFHLLDLRAGSWRAEHRCGADAYRGEFRAPDRDRLTIRWHVTGPGRDDVIASDYRRLGR